MLKKVIFFGWFHRTCLQGCFDFSIFALLSLNYTRSDSFICIFDFFCCFLIFVIIIQAYILIFLFVQLHFLIKIQFPISSEELEDKFPYFSCIFKGLKCNSWNGCLHNLVFIARRLSLSLGIIYLNGILQLLIGITFTFAVIHK